MRIAILFTLYWSGTSSHSLHILGLSSSCWPGGAELGGGIASAYPTHKEVIYFSRAQMSSLARKLAVGRKICFRSLGTR